MIEKLFKRLFSRDYGLSSTEFALLMGYKTWKEAQGNTYAMFFTEVDDWWFATELPDGQWAVWKEEGDMPYPFTVFSSRSEAIEHLRVLFIKSALPERNWIEEASKKKGKVLVDKETQIQILLRGNALQFACETLGVKDMRIREYAEVFTVSMDEVYDYALKQGLPQSGSTRDDMLIEGFHYYKKDGKWHTFFRERGQTFDEKNFNDEELGKRYIIKTLVQLSGTGLY
ncbi:hypothetical protein FQ085_13790 [Planococcus sp. ANT_H30]|uniref:Uncharacterized protein n=1 Tax=Planococcus kocurii TaxID=1374 RepID=A0ABM5WSG6_9BACL|nr:MULTISPECIES: hypothetical protein [Planococcus]ALS77289.1 hypothetical protein AUO94_00910 [Planococcus kocurii]KAA0956186.1 hypothetical protein FQ085_13790 [Planococcus sp. ANT_H30]